MEIFLPTSLPPWVRTLVAGMVVFQVVAVCVYAACLVRECGRPKEQQYERVRLHKGD